AFGSLNATMPYYPLNDYTHTSWSGAEINAEALVTAVKCGHFHWRRSQLASYLNCNASKIDYPC
ncbi:hypothetical protein KXV52_008907, partial [Aspergillus fumigatus]